MTDYGTQQELHNGLEDSGLFSRDFENFNLNSIPEQEVFTQTDSSWNNTWNFHDLDFPTPQMPVIEDQSSITLGFPAAQENGSSVAFYTPSSPTAALTVAADELPHPQLYLPGAAPDRNTLFNDIEDQSSITLGFPVGEVNGSSTAFYTPSLSTAALTAAADELPHTQLYLPGAVPERNTLFNDIEDQSSVTLSFPAAEVNGSSTAFYAPSSSTTVAADELPHPQLYLPGVAPERNNIYNLIDTLGSVSRPSPSLPLGVAAGELPQYLEEQHTPVPALPLAAGSYLQSNFLPYQHNPYNSYFPPNSFNSGASTSGASNSPPTPQSAVIPTHPRQSSSKPRRQPATRAPRRNHPKDDELSKTTVFYCQWVSTPNSAPCGKAIVSRAKMLEHLNCDHERIETDKRRSCLWLGCKFGDPDRPLSATSSFNNHVEDVHLKVEGSRKRNVRFDPY